MIEICGMLYQSNTCFMLSFVIFRSALLHLELLQTVTVFRVFLSKIQLSCYNYNRSTILSFLLTCF